MAEVNLAPVRDHLTELIPIRIHLGQVPPRLCHRHRR